MHFSAGRGVSLVAEFDKVRGQFPENVLLTTKNHHIGMVAELVQPANSAGRRLHELATCLETVVIYFSAGRGVSLVAEFDKVRGPFPENVLLTTKITTLAWWPSLCSLPTLPGDDYTSLSHVR